MKTLATFLALLCTVQIHAQSPVNDSEVFTMVEETPEFPGGQDSLLRYLGSITYPVYAKENDITGAVYAKFVIEKNGDVSSVEVARSSGSAILDSAVVAHVRLMPAWKPGTQQGKPVRVEYVVPIKFNLVGAEKPKKKKRGQTLFLLKAF